MFLTAAAQAATEVDLFQERVVVSQNAGQSELDEAIESAFEQVIVRVTGGTQSLTNSAVESALQSGDEYLASFRFDTSREFFTNVLGEKIPTKTMVLDFDRQAVENLLRSNRLPIWGARRPEILIWLADRSQGQDNILNDNENSTLANRVNFYAKQRGIPLILPIMDLTDTLALPFTSLFGLFSQEIELASERYDEDAILAGKIVKTGDNYSADWLLIFRGERIRLPTASGSMDTVVKAGINMVAERMASQYASIFDPLALNSVAIKVVDVPNLTVFADIERYLASLTLVTNVTATSFSEQSVVFDLQISGDQFQLTDVLALDGQLVPVVEVGLRNQLDSELLFQWSELQ